MLKIRHEYKEYLFLKKVHFTGRVRKKSSQEYKEIINLVSLHYK
ncbi:hypothetical protein Cop2CBH44_01130 [Coprobacter secundus subsp. similis]|uniref:Uncharacterized protein n=1 Tax=Coprobacter secundus subsp. similis TaxID=2751153 RepID=A0A7G1HQN4_9BACT|nr:hypothetical protein Cop2CBH44_01130 [Coprobacter secundus subsp. similis]